MKMTKNTKLLSAALAATALAGVSAEAANAATSSAPSTPAAVSSAHNTATPMTARAQSENARLTALAKSLGVTTAQLHSAFDKLRENAPKPSASNSAPPAKGTFASALAKQLNLSQTTVQKALDANRPAHGFGGPRGFGGGHFGGPRMQHKSASTTQTKAVNKAITSKASSMSVKSVDVTPRGNFVAFGTQNGKFVVAHVSSDYKNVKVDAPKGNPVPGGHHAIAPVARQDI